MKILKKSFDYIYKEFSWGNIPNYDKTSFISSKFASNEQLHSSTAGLMFPRCTFSRTLDKSKKYYIYKELLLRSSFNFGRNFLCQPCLRVSYQNLIGGIGFFTLMHFKKIISPLFDYLNIAFLVVPVALIIIQQGKKKSKTISINSIG